MLIIREKVCKKIKKLLDLFPANSSMSLGYGLPVSFGVEDNQRVVKFGDPDSAIGYIIKTANHRKIATISCERAVIKTFAFNKNNRYPINAVLYVQDGQYTSDKPNELAIGIGVVTMPPTTADSRLELLWL